MKSACFTFFIATLLSLAACSEGETKKKAEPPPVPVTTAKAVERDVPVTLQVVGRAEAYESVALKSRIEGQVDAVLFTEGQQVKQGDVLIRLDPADFSARLRQTEATAARDEALIAKSRADTERYAALKARNFVSEEKVNDIRTSEAAAQANLRASKAAAELSRLQLSYTVIRAPITGVLGARLVFPGTAIKANETIVTVINRVRPLLISFSVPEKHLPRMREAMKSGHMKVDVSLPSDASLHFEGEVRFIDNAVDVTTGTILMKAELPNTDEKLTPGQFLNVTVLLDTLTKAVTVPAEAVQQGADGNFLFVVKADRTVENRRIEVAASNAGVTAISKGVLAGETVVIDGQLRLNPGIKIREAGPSGEKGKAETAAAAPAPAAR